MVVMTLDEGPRRTPLMPPFGEWTVDDLDRLPDEPGLQFELLDGLLLVTPGPIPVHQSVVLNLGILLKPGAPPPLRVYIAPLDWRPDRWTNLQPDALVVHPDAVGPKNVPGDLLLAVEVLSPSTRRKDLWLKRSKYEECGVQSYWIVDPEAESITVLELDEGKYRTTAELQGEDTLALTRPFPLELHAAALFRP